MDCCGVGVCGPYILLNGLDDIIDDAEVGGGVMCDDCLLKIPTKQKRTHTGVSVGVERAHGGLLAQNVGCVPVFWAGDDGTDAADDGVDG